MSGQKSHPVYGAYFQDSSHLVAIFSGVIIYHLTWSPPRSLAEEYEGPAQEDPQIDYIRHSEQPISDNEPFNSLYASLP